MRSGSGAKPAARQAEARHLAAPRPQAPVSHEIRRLEFEIRTLDLWDPGPAKIPAYLLYYVCEDVRGRCLYRRQDLEIPMVIRPGPP